MMPLSLEINMSEAHHEKSEKHERKGQRTRYKKISEELREEIIERLLVRKEGLREVASKLHINHSTCKAIVKVFESEGRIGKKKTRNRNASVINTFTFCVVDRGALVDLSETQITEKKVTYNRTDDIDDLVTEQAKNEGGELAREYMEVRQRTHPINIPQYSTTNSRIFAYHPLKVELLPQPFSIAICPQLMAYNVSNF